LHESFCILNFMVDIFIDFVAKDTYSHVGYKKAILAVYTKCLPIGY
jgi:hypothetical protein